ncbi:MAG: DUF3395 domain-containing protein [Kangiellaceae bacterium]|jgi:hypothetical protein|nr:DUF3395 domain-containing protein [Kangiellaceae bacterium]
MIRDRALASFERESNKSGLVILSALFGDSDQIADVMSEKITLDSDHAQQVIDVKAPLQFLVEESRLVITSASFSRMSGFYNPLIGTPNYKTK